MHQDESKYVRVLLERFPEFKETSVFREYTPSELESSYLVFGDFARFIVDCVEENDGTEQVIMRLVDFLNNLYKDEGSDQSLRNLSSAELFEVFAMHKETLTFFRGVLTGAARKALELSLLYAGLEMPDFTIVPEAQQVLEKFKELNKKKNDREVVS